MTRALVTGAARRLGRHMALELADRGYDVVVHYAGSSDEALSVVSEIKEKGQGAAAVQADLTVEAEMQSLMPRASDALQGSITTLVNNASIFERDTMLNASRESWDRHLESNLRAPFVLTQAFAAQVPDPLRDDFGEPLAQGLVVNMIDQRVRKLTPDFASYTIAKSALWTLTKTSAQALAPRVRVNAIGPGPTLQGEHQSAEQFQRQRAATLLGRGANISDITGALSYFLNATSVTGQMLCVDGGQHLAWETPDVLDTE